MIKINLDAVTNNHKYKDLALLFDRSDFQKDLNELQKIIKKEAKKHPDLASSLTNVKSPTAYDYARKLAQKYKYPLGFTKAIFYAASFGKVTNEDVVKCYSKVLMHPQSVLNEYSPKLTKKDLVVFVDPHAVKGNKDVILDEIGLILDEILRASTSLPIHPLSIGPKKKVERDRGWYWIWLEKQGRKNEKGIYNEILDHWNRLCPETDVEPHDEKNCHHCVFSINTIEQAVSRYRKELLIKIS